jgi:hypothetical protein
VKRDWRSYRPRSRVRDKGGQKVNRRNPKAMLLFQQPAKPY